MRRLGDEVPPHFVLTVFPEGGRVGRAPDGEFDALLTAVLGTTDRTLQITQISVDVESQLG